MKNILKNKKIAIFLIWILLIVFTIIVFMSFNNISKNMCFKISKYKYQKEIRNTVEDLVLKKW